MKLLLIFVLISCCLSPANALTYVMTDLGTMGGSSSSGAFINDLGQIVGVITKPHPTNPEYYAPYIWDNGEVTYLDSFGTRGYPRGLNNKGQVVGQVYGADGADHAVIWEKGSRTILYEYNSAAYGINDSGQVVGYRNTPYPYTDSGAFLWDTGNTVTLGNIGAYGINNSSHTIVDYSLWKEGILIDLVSPAGHIRPAAINDNDQIIGYDGGRAILWDNGKITDLASFYSVDSIYAFDINNSGQVVGYAQVGNRTFYFVSNGDVLTELPGRIRGINNNRQLVGDMIFSDGHQHAVRWDPVVPEPTSLLALFTGIGILGLARLRARR